MKKPESLEGLMEGLKQLYTKAHDNANRADRLYNRDLDGLMEVPEGVTIFESSTPTRIIDSLRDQVRVDEPRVEFEARGTTKADQKHKGTLEMWGSHLMREMNRQAVVPPAQQAFHDGLLRGAECVKVTVKKEVLDDVPGDKASPKQIREWYKKRAGKWPWVVKPIDPLNVFISPGAFPPRFVLEVQNRLSFDILSDYGEDDPSQGLEAWRNKKGRKDGDAVQWIEYWDEEHYIVEVDGQRVIDKPNPYGKIPYAFRWSGLGRQNFDGDPSALMKGILHDIGGELEKEVVIKTALAAQIQFHVFPTLVTTMKPLDAKKAFSRGPGRIISVPSMDDMPQWLTVEQPNAAMYQFLDKVERAIEAKVNPALGGERAAGVDAAIHQALIIGQSIKVISPVRASLNALFTDVLNLMACQAHILNLDMTVWAKVGEAAEERMVKAKDLGLYNFKVSFDQVDPVENDRRMLAGLAIMRSGLPLMSRLTFMQTYLKGVVKDASEEEERIMVEKVLDQIVESGTLAQATLQEMAAQEQAAAQAGVLAGVVEQAQGAAQSQVSNPGSTALEALGVQAGTTGEAQQTAKVAKSEGQPY